MPRLDGAGVLKALKAAPEQSRRFPVIVSAYDSEVMHNTAEELGARHFLPKPVLPESLRDLVRWLAGDETAFAPFEQKAAAPPILRDCGCCWSKTIRSTSNLRSN